MKEETKIEEAKVSIEGEEKRQEGVEGGKKVMKSNRTGD